MRIVAEKPWTWTLFRDDAGIYVLSTVCGGVAQYGIEMVLSPGEADAYEGVGTDSLDALAQEVSRNPAAYTGRAIEGFIGRAEVKDAIVRWRAQSGRSD